MNKLGFALLLLLCASLSRATTLIVFYDSARGAILATDSSVASASAGQFQSSHISGTGTQCKINRCGKYWMASAGLDITGNDEITRKCVWISDAQGIDDVMRVVLQPAAELASRFVSDLVNNKTPPKPQQHIYSLAIVGFERGKPVLRYRELRFVGLKGSQALFKSENKIACPGSPQCKELREGTGLFEDIVVAKSKGKYPKTKDPLQLAEDLVNIEIEAHRGDRLVLPPVTVIQINGLQPSVVRQAD